MHKKGFFFLKKNSLCIPLKKQENSKLIVVLILYSWIFVLYFLNKDNGMPGNIWWKQMQMDNIEAYKS